MRQISRSCLLALALPVATAAQSPASVPPGFALRPVVTETVRPTAVRTVAMLGDGALVAIGRDLEKRQPGSAPRTVLRLHPGEDFGFVLAADPQTAIFSELHGGQIRVLDLPTGTVTATFPGVANAFDAIALPGGDVLLSANPLWPAAAANSGIWLAGPGRIPRELLALSGPSTPLTLAANGDLITGELGAMVPPPPGNARLLRFPASLLQQAIAGATLQTSQASATGSGHSGIYDLAFDDLGRLHVTDPSSSVVRHCPPGSLTPTGFTVDVGSGRYALHLHFHEHAFAPFTGFQPSSQAPALSIAHSDFAQGYSVERLEPRRPTVTLTPAGPLPPGTAALSLAGAPANGLAVFLITPASAMPEYVAATLGGVPLWLGLPPSAVIAPWHAAIDGQGTATSSLTNPGGYGLTFTLQVAALGLPGTAAASSTSPHSLVLQP